jgi:Competence-damaged protein
MAETFSSILSCEVEADITELLRQLCDKGLRLATAESCTGGLLASLFTDVPGCSHVFEAGFVVYSDEAKESMLGVPVDLLIKFGGGQNLLPWPWWQEPWAGQARISLCRSPALPVKVATAKNRASSILPARNERGLPNTGRCISATLAGAKRALKIIPVTVSMIRAEIA